jgi:hypothetical protein
MSVASTLLQQSWSSRPWSRSSPWLSLPLLSSPPSLVLLLLLFAPTSNFFAVAAAAAATTTADNDDHDHDHYDHNHDYDHDHQSASIYVSSSPPTTTMSTPLPSLLFTTLTTLITRTCIILAFITIGPWALWIVYDIVLYLWRTITYEIPFVGGRARGGFTTSSSTVSRPDPGPVIVSRSLAAVQMTEKLDHNP